MIEKEDEIDEIIVTSFSLFEDFEEESVSFTP